MKNVTHDVDYYMSLQYPIRVEPLPRELGGGWIAYIPALGRKVFRATGETAEEALGQLGELKKVYFAHMVEAGREIPSPPQPESADYGGQVLVRMSPAMHAELASRAGEQRVSLNSFCVTLLSRGLGEELAVEQFKARVSEVLQPVLSQGWRVAESQGDTPAYQTDVQP